MQLVLLCGGLGSRIKKIDDINPKGMIKINNRPFIDYVIKSIENYNFSSIHFCLGFKSQKYLHHLEKNYSHLNYTYSIEKEEYLLGTGGAIKNCLDFLEDNFIIQYGDTIVKLNYSEFYKLHLKEKKPITMSILNSYKSEEAPNLFCKKSSFGKFECIYNKKNPPLNANYIDYGSLACKKEIFNKKAEKIFDLSDMQEEFSKRNLIYFHEVYEKYIEIGTPFSYEKAKLKLNDI
tara:strand:- start:111 stop:812 length:702 start_codon:yes stop_codon:yes gene_type:complete